MDADAKLIATWVVGGRDAVYFVYYKFGRVHQMLRVTPAMEPGVANHIWSIEKS